MSLRKAWLATFAFFSEFGKWKQLKKKGYYYTAQITNNK